MKVDTLMKKEINLKLLKDKQGFEGPYKVPQNYFVDFSKKMQSKIKEIDPIAGLEKLKREGIEDFYVPENYFEFLPKQILSKISDQKNRPKIFKMPFAPILIQVGIAASLALLFIVNIPKEMENTSVKKEVLYSQQMNKNLEQLEKMDVSEDVLIEAILKKGNTKKEKQKIYFNEPSIEESVVLELDVNEIIEQL